jgi:hypothetical protein
MYVGDVRVTIKYRKVTLNMSEMFRGEYHPERYQPGAIWMTLWDNRGRTVFNGGLTEEAFDSTHTLLKIALVQGKWTVKLSFDDGGRNFQSRRMFIDTESYNSSVQ